MRRSAHQRRSTPLGKCHQVLQLQAVYLREDQQERQSVLGGGHTVLYHPRSAQGQRRRVTTMHLIGLVAHTWIGWQTGE